jgi:Immunity protein 53
MGEIDLLGELQRWYESNCDGDWEHDWGAQIGTLDNPGWRVDLRLEGTVLEGQPFERQQIDITDRNWHHCEVKDNVFRGRGGAANLSDILRVFVEWWHTHGDRTA